VGDPGSSARAIENLVYAYAERMDDGDLQGIGELFRHGVLRPAPGIELTGVDEVRGLYEGTTRLYEDGTPRSHHVTTNVAVEVDEHTGTGSARSYFTVLQQTDALALQPIIAGRYHDTFHRLEGVWWFASREMVVTLKGDLSQHLTFEL
jgi:hypothetical protein